MNNRKQNYNKNNTNGIIKKRKKSSKKLATNTKPKKAPKPAVTTTAKPGPMKESAPTAPILEQATTVMQPEPSRSEPAHQDHGEAQHQALNPLPFPENFAVKNDNTH